LYDVKLERESNELESQAETGEFNNEAPSGYIQHLHLKQSGSLARACAALAEFPVDLGTAIVAARQNSRRSNLRPSRQTISPAASDAKLVNAADAARICGISRTLWFDLRAAGRVPKPLRLGRRVLWNRDELDQWMAAGCPPHHEWARLKSQESTASKKAKR
jgi:prophage regulatory protein